MANKLWEDLQAFGQLGSDAPDIRDSNITVDYSDAATGVKKKV
jgi:hypothetical protein